MARRGSSSAVTTVSMEAPPPLADRAVSVEPIFDQETLPQAQLIGLLLHLGQPALTTIIGNGLEAGDFSEEGFERLFLLARSAHLSGEPCAFEGLLSAIRAQGLEEAAATARKSAENLTLADVPILAQRCFREALYRHGMMALGGGFNRLQASAEGGAPLPEMAQVLESAGFQLLRLSKRGRSG